MTNIELRFMEVVPTHLGRIVTALEGISAELKEQKQAATPKLWIVTYVGLSDTEYDANGYSEVKVCTSLEDAKKKLKEWRDNEIECLKSEERDYQILEDDDDECRISWCGHGEQIRLQIHAVE